MADQPDRGGTEEDGQDEQPASLDVLEMPEAAGRLIGVVLQVALFGEPLLDGLGGRQAACLAELAAEAGDFGLTGGGTARLDPPLGEDPRGSLAGSAGRADERTDKSGEQAIAATVREQATRSIALRGS